MPGKLHKATLACVLSAGLMLYEVIIDPTRYSALLSDRVVGAFAQE